MKQKYRFNWVYVHKEGYDKLREKLSVQYGDKLARTVLTMCEPAQVRIFVNRGEENLDDMQQLLRCDCDESDPRYYKYYVNALYVDNKENEPIGMIKTQQKAIERGMRLSKKHCPECGCPWYGNKNVLSAGERTCVYCSQDWFFQSVYEAPAARQDLLIDPNETMPLEKLVKKQREALNEDHRWDYGFDKNFPEEE